jgi:hypothetical protein
MNAFSLKIIAVAAALAVSGSASAAIDGFASGNGELFLNIFDSTAAVSFTADLKAPTVIQGSLAAANAGNPTLSSFTAAGLSAPGLILRWDLNSYSYSPAAGGTVNPWTSFIGSASAGNSVFNVVAGDSVGSLGTAGTLNYLSTSSSALATIQSQTNSQLNNFKSVDAVATGLVPGVNGLPGHNLQDDGASVATAGNGTAYFPVGLGSNWKGSAAFDSTGSVANALPFYLLSNSGIPTTKPVDLTTYGGVFRVDMQQGFLFYQTPAAAVPEPGTWMLLMAGLIGVSAISRRRLAA